MIEARGLTRSFGGQIAVADVDLRVDPGEIVGFLGPNGAGKTTTLRLLAGALRPDRGEARVGGRDVHGSDASTARASVGWLPERPPLHTELTVRAHLRYVAALYGRGEADVDSTLERYDLGSVAGRRTGHLSKGWGQRVGLAVATLHRPAALLLDEPTSGLDPGQRTAFRAQIRALAADGVAVLLSSHILAEVEALADRAVVLAGGQVRGALDLRSPPGIRLAVQRPEGLADALRRLDGVVAVAQDDDGLTVNGGDTPAIAAAAVPHGLLSLGPDRRLEASYLRLVDGGPA